MKADTVQWKQFGGDKIRYATKTAILISVRCLAVLAGTGWIWTSVNTPFYFEVVSLPIEGRLDERVTTTHMQ